MLVNKTADIGAFPIGNKFFLMLNKNHLGYGQRPPQSYIWGRRGRVIMESLQDKFMIKDVKRVVAFLCLVFSISWTVSGASLKAEQNTVKTHGFNFFGELKYPPDFKHLDYVNPNAPKGGEISIWGFGTFDSMNPYSRKGRAASLSSAPFESLLVETGDEIGSSYGCLLYTSPSPRDKRQYRIPSCA